MWWVTAIERNSTPTTQPLESAGGISKIGDFHLVIKGQFDHLQRLRNSHNNYLETRLHQTISKSKYEIKKIPEMFISAKADFPSQELALVDPLKRLQYFN